MLKVQKRYSSFNLGWFELHAVDHCNLRCNGCNHHSWMLKKAEYKAEDYFPHIDEMLRRNINFDTIGILGGEPFLHSDISNFVLSIKNRYKKKVTLTTNGFWLRKDWKKYHEMFSILSDMWISIYNPIEKSIGRDKMISEINQIKQMYSNMNVTLRDHITHFIELKFTSEPEKPTSFCHAQGNCTNLMPDGRLARCGVGAYADKNPEATKEFLNNLDDLFYDLTIDDGKSFEEWKTKFPLRSCDYCTMWKNKSIPWQMR